MWNDFLIGFYLFTAWFGIGLIIGGFLYVQIIY